MRHVPVLALFLLASCDCTGADGAAEPAPDESPAGLEMATEDQLEAEQESSASRRHPDPAQMRAKAVEFRSLIREGREHAGAERWQQAAESFERALLVDPADGRARCELGWLRFRGGDSTAAELALDRGLEDLNSVPEPNNRALGMCLYNRGRLAEANQKEEQARTYYAHSLDRRPNRIVRARLEALGSVPEVDGAALDALLSAAVASLTGRGRGLGEDYQSERELLTAIAAEACAEDHTCATDGDAPAPAVNVTRDRISLDEADQNHAVLVRVASGTSGTVGYYLAFQLGDLWRFGDQVVSEYNPGAFGIYQEVEISLSLHEPDGGDDPNEGDGPDTRNGLVVVDVTHHGTDSDLGIDEEEGWTEKSLHIWGLTDAGLPEQLATVVYDYSYTRDTMGMAEDGEVRAEERTPGLPIERRWSRSVELVGDGYVLGPIEVDTGEVDRSAHLAAGEFPL